MRADHAHRLALAPLLLLAGACAPLEWHHGGSEERNVDLDQAQCTAQAQLEARQRMPLHPFPAPQVVVDQRGRNIIVQNRQPDSERFLLEHTLLRQCMSKRGYTLQPKPQKTG